MDLIKNIGAIAGCVISCVSLFTLACKPIRKRLCAMGDSIGTLVELFQGVQEREKQRDEALLCMLRNTITMMHYKYTELACLPNYERENLVKLYNSYHAMHGNSYVDIVYQELLALPRYKGDDDDIL